MTIRHARRSPFGDQDQIGAMHYVKPEMLISLLRVKRDTLRKWIVAKKVRAQKFTFHRISW
jgi:hypothetical protein